MHSTHWNDRFIALAAAIGEWSRDPSTQCGAIVVRPDKTLASVGFNGFPRGVDDSPERYADRETKYAMVVHAEANAIVNAREPLHGCSIYVHPLLPCSSCASLIIQAGIVEVVTLRATGERMERWRKSFETTELMFREAGVPYYYLD
jgi:dCMP deaminase